MTVNQKIYLYFGYIVYQNNRYIAGSWWQWPRYQAEHVALDNLSRAEACIGCQAGVLNVRDMSQTLLFTITRYTKTYDNKIT